jgi:hypothetical protein
VLFNAEQHILLCCVTNPSNADHAVGLGELDP